jgi:hypothetical protein
MKQAVMRLGDECLFSSTLPTMLSPLASLWWQSSGTQNVGVDGRTSRKKAAEHKQAPRQNRMLING